MSELEPGLYDWFVYPVLYPGLLWGRYETAIGAELMKATFGDHWPPLMPRPGETVFAVRDNNCRQPMGSDPEAWISLTRDQFDSKNYYMSRGVWPKSHGKGLGKFLRSWAEDYARADGGDCLTIWVSETNQQHLRQVIDDEYWTQSGSNWIPPGSHSFYHEIEP